MRKQLFNVPMITDWEPYLPVFTGLGTVTSITFWWRRVGSTMEILGGFTTGTCTAANASITIPSGKNINSLNTTAIMACGHLVPSTTTNPANKHLVALMSNNDTAIFFSQTRTDSAVNPLVAQLGNAVFLDANRYSTVGPICIPIVQWRANKRGR